MIGSWSRGIPPLQHKQDLKPSTTITIRRRSDESETEALIAFVDLMVSGKPPGDISITQHDILSYLDTLKKNTVEGMTKEIREKITGTEYSELLRLLPNCVALYNEKNGKQIQLNTQVFVFGQDISCLSNVIDQLSISTIRQLQSAGKSSLVIQDQNKFWHSRLTSAKVMHLCGQLGQSPEQVLEANPELRASYEAINALVQQGKNFQEIFNDYPEFRLFSQDVASDPRGRSYLEMRYTPKLIIFHAHPFNYAVNIIIQQIQKGVITIEEADKIKNFIHSYKSQEFTNRAEHLEWIEQKLSDDKVLEKFCSPGYKIWPDLKHHDYFGLGTVLILRSEAIQNFALANSEALRCVKNRRCINQLLEASNNMIIQDYFTDDKFTLDQLASINSITGTQILDDVQTPLVMQYVNENRQPGLLELIQSSNLEHTHVTNILFSIEARAAVARKDFTMDQLLAIAKKWADFEFYYLDGQNLLNYLFKSGYLKYDQIMQLTKRDWKNLYKVLDALEKGDLVIQDVLDQNHLFCKSGDS